MNDNDLSMTNVKKHIHKDMMIPRGETVTVERENISYVHILNGIRPVEVECRDFAECNPGTLRMVSSTGEILWCVAWADNKPT